MEKTELSQDMNEIERQNNCESGNPHDPNDHELFWVIKLLPSALTTIVLVGFFLLRNLSHVLWGFNLWHYLLPPLPQIFFALIVAFSLSSVLQFMRKKVLRFENVSLDLKSRPALRLLVQTAVLLCLFIILLSFSENRTAGDSQILVAYAQRGVPFLIQNTGGTFLFFLASSVARKSGLSFDFILKMMICSSGLVFFFYLHKLAHLAFKSRIQGLLAFAFLAAAGYVRVFFGHIEVYAFLLSALCAYFYFSALCLEKKCGVFMPAFLLGVAFWIHLSAICLLPSFIYLLFGRETETSSKGSHWKSVIGSVFLFLSPFVCFFLLLIIYGHGPFLGNMLSRFIVSTLRNENQVGVPMIMPLFRSREYTLNNAALTIYPFFSKNNLLFFINAHFMLSPVGILTVVPLIFYYLAKRGSSNQLFRFLIIASIPLLLYSLLLYPHYGAYDWDMFSSSAFCYTLLAAYLLFHYFEDDRVSIYLSIYLVSFSLFINTIPLILIGSQENIRAAGPFKVDNPPYSLILREKSDDGALPER